MTCVGEGWNGGVGRSEGQNTAAPTLADGVSLAAAPVFAAMAVLTGVLGPPAIVCSAAHASVLGGMAAMYALMGAFHAPPWLRLISSRRSAARRPMAETRDEPPAHSHNVVSS